MRRSQRQAGFTLIEVLVASAIFAIVMAMAFMTIRGAARQRDRVDESLARMHQIQTAMQLIGRDLFQLQPRSVRDIIGDDRLPALTTGADGGGIEFTTGGWSNPASLHRSVLQRVGYQIDEDALFRSHWPVLDRTQASLPTRRKILDGILALSVRFFPAQGDPSEDWPPLAVGGPNPDAQLPLAVEVTLELEDHGLVTRLIEVAQ